MAWPLTPLTTYIAANLPRVKAFDLNQIQDAIVKLVGAGYSIKQLLLDGTGGASYTPSTGDDAPAIETSEIGATGAAKRKLLWKIKLATTPVYARFYGGNAGSSSALEIVINAAWDSVGQQWTADTTSGKVIEIVLCANAGALFSWRYYDTGGGATFTDGDWVSNSIDARDGVAISKEGITAAGTIHEVISAYDTQDAVTANNRAITGNCNFRKAFPSTPGTVSIIASIVPDVNLTGGAFATDALSKWHLQGHRLSNAAGAASFNTEITVS